MRALALGNQMWQKERKQGNKNIKRWGVDQVKVESGTAVRRIQGVYGGKERNCGKNRFLNVKLNSDRCVECKEEWSRLQWVWEFIPEIGWCVSERVVYDFKGGGCRRGSKIDDIWRTDSVTALSIDEIIEVCRLRSGESFICKRE